MTTEPGAALGSSIVTDEQAKAVGRLASFGTTVATETSNLAHYIGRIVGTVPEDAIGLVIGDPLHAIRTLTAGWYDAKVREILERRGVKETQPVSLSVALPLMRGAYDENREELRELWARLIAAAMDPSRADRVRISYIDTLRQLDPLDARVLQTLPTNKPLSVQDLVSLLDVSTDEVIISTESLRRLGCLSLSGAAASGGYASPYGRGLLRAVSDLA
jgi:hypothetical protein